MKESGCKTCTNSGDCTVKDQKLAHSEVTVDDTKSVKVEYEAWEDDVGSRCTYTKSSWYRGGDDCHEKKTCTFSLDATKRTSGTQMCNGKNHWMKMGYKWVRA